MTPIMTISDLRAAIDHAAEVVDAAVAAEAHNQPRPQTISALVLAAGMLRLAAGHAPTIAEQPTPQRPPEQPITRRAEDAGWHGLARAVRERRQQLGLSQRDLSRLAGLSLNTLGRIETARRDAYSPATLQALENGLQWEPGSASEIVIGPRIGDVS